MYSSSSVFQSKIGYALLVRTIVVAVVVAVERQEHKPLVLSGQDGGSNNLNSVERASSISTSIIQVRMVEVG